MKKHHEMIPPAGEHPVTVHVEVDVTKIVRSLCFCAICVVGIIWGVGGWLKSMKYQSKE